MANLEIEDFSQTTTPASTNKVLIQTAGGVTEYQTRADLHELQSGEVVVLAAGSAAAPAIGWTNTGFLESASDQIGVSLGGAEQWTWGGGVVTSVWTLLAQTTTSWRLDSSVASVTNPTLIPHRQSTNTGVGGAYSNILCLITNSVNAINIDATQLVTHTASLSASTGNEVAHTLNYTTNKSSSGTDTGLVINQTDTASPGVSRLLDLQVGGTSKVRVDNTGTLELDKTTADEGFLNFVGTADGDATSAISTLTTSGSVSHHIQVSINGTTAWLAASTTDPS